MDLAQLITTEIANAFAGDVTFAAKEGWYSATMANESGTGTMLFYDVMPGISLAYCNYAMATCDSGLRMTDKDVLCVDYCRSGRLEQSIGGGAFAYLAAGDLKIDDRRNHTGEFIMPVSEYQGITVSFDIDVAQKSIEGELGGFPVNLRRLRDRFCSGGKPFIIHGLASVNHIFSELYSIPDNVRAAYFKIKVLELLLFLEMVDPGESDTTRPYFNRNLVQKVKAAHDLMVGDVSQSYTIDELADLFKIAPTAFKACFKGIYGQPPHRYLKQLRMEHAEKMLADTDRPISEIALAVGYESPSKFAAAFSVYAGQTPTVFRRADED